MNVKTYFAGLANRLAPRIPVASSRAHGSKVIYPLVPRIDGSNRVVEVRIDPQNQQKPK